MNFELKINQLIKYDFPLDKLAENDVSYHLNNPQVYMDQWKLFFEPGDYVLDIGAYIGIISIHLAFLGAVVYAFEGAPSNHDRLESICKPLRQIIIHRKAVSNKNYDVKTRFNDCIGREHKEQNIQYVVYDEYAKQHSLNDPKFVKIDIEGMESIALLGMSNLIENVRPIWQIEWHKGTPFKYSDFPGFVSVEEGGFDFEKFGKLDYEIFDINLKSIKLEDFELYGNYFFIPKEKINLITKSIKLI